MGILEGQVDTENIQFKIDSWFSKDEQSREKWNSFIKKCTNNHKIDETELENYYNDFSSSKQFVDYIKDNVGYYDNEINYKDQFIQIVRLTAGV